MDKFYGRLEYFAVIWYTISHFGKLHPEKSGNPVLQWNNQLA
jgi:hypothetical protein